MLAKCHEAKGHCRRKRVACELFLYAPPQPPGDWTPPAGQGMLG